MPAETVTVTTGSGSGKAWVWALSIFSGLLLIGGVILFILWDKEKNRDKPKSGGTKGSPTPNGEIGILAGRMAGRSSTTMGSGELGYVPKPDQTAVQGGKCGQGYGTWANDGSGGLYCMSIAHAPKALS